MLAGAEVADLSMVWLDGELLMVFVLRHASEPGVYAYRPSRSERPWQIAGAEVRCGNQRLCILPPSRLLLPVWSAARGHYCLISDDGGRTWRPGGGSVQASPNKRCVPPSVVARRDGSVLMFMRIENAAEVMFMARSVDGGETWTMHCDWGPVALLASFAVIRPGRLDDLMLVWLNHAFPSQLTVGWSSDGGRLWDRFWVVEAQHHWPLDWSYHQPAVAELGDCVHLTYLAERNDGTGAQRQVYRQLSMAALRSSRPSRPPVLDLDVMVRQFVAQHALHDPTVTAMVIAPLNPGAITQPSRVAGDQP